MDVFPVRKYGDRSRETSEFYTTGENYFLQAFTYFQFLLALRATTINPQWCTHIGDQPVGWMCQDSVMCFLGEKKRRELATPEIILHVSMRRVVIVQHVPLGPGAATSKEIHSTTFKNILFARSRPDHMGRIPAAKRIREPQGERSEGRRVTAL